MGKSLPPVLVLVDGEVTGDRLEPVPVTWSIYRCNTLDGRMEWITPRGSVVLKDVWVLDF